MNIVYWTAKCGDTIGPHSKQFPIGQLNEALVFSELLRKHKRENTFFNETQIIGYITMSCEHPDSVGQQGVDVTDSTYDWSKKHRGAGPVA